MNKFTSIPMNSHIRLTPLILGRAAAISGDQILELTILWSVWDLTHSSTIMALATFSGRAPLWIFSLAGASLSHKIGPAKLIFLVNIYSCCLCLIIATVMLSGFETAILFILLAFLVNSARAVEAAALTAAIPLLTNKDAVQSANSKLDNAKRIGRLLAPLSSKLLGIVNPAIFIAASGILFGFMSIAVKRYIEITARPKNLSESHGDLKNAVKTVWKNRTLKTIIGFAAVYAFFHATFYYVIIPRISFEGASGSAFAFGILVTIIGIGGVCANFLITIFPIHNRVGAIAFGILVAGVSFGAFSLLPPTEVRYFLAFMIGASLPFQDVFIICVIQELSPPELTARIHAIWRLCCEAAIGTGLLVGGLSVDLFGVEILSILGGATIITIGIALPVLVGFRSAHR